MIQIITAEEVKSDINPDKRKRLFNSMVRCERDTCITNRDRIFSIALKKEIFGYDVDDIDFVFDAGYCVNDTDDYWTVTLP